MRILLLGGTGQVGFELQRSLANMATIVAPTRIELDLLNEQAVRDYLHQQQTPDVIVNAAAWTAVDAAESNPSAALRLNAELPDQLARYAATQGISLVHYSSDYVYSGQGDEPWTEDSPTAPLCVYGRSKLAGDRAIQDSGADYLIFRTCWVYGARGHNFMNTMLRLGKEKETLGIVTDQIGAPTTAALIADITALAIRQPIATGLYHLACAGETSWYGFAQEIFRQARATGHVLKLQADGVKPILTKDYPTPAQRPLNSRLSLQKIEHTLGITLPDWQSQLIQGLR